MWRWVLQWIFIYLFIWLSSIPSWEGTITIKTSFLLLEMCHCVHSWELESNWGQIPFTSILASSGAGIWLQRGQSVSPLQPLEAELSKCCRVWWIWRKSSSSQQRWPVDIWMDLFLLGEPLWFQDAWPSRSCLVWACFLSLFLQPAWSPHNFSFA